MKTYNWMIKHGDGTEEQGLLTSDSEDRIRDFLSYAIPKGSVIAAISPIDDVDTKCRIILDV